MLLGKAKSADKAQLQILYLDDELWVHRTGVCVCVCVRVCVCACVRACVRAANVQESTGAPD
jgi:hypothetical protein